MSLQHLIHSVAKLRVKYILNWPSVVQLESVPRIIISVVYIVHRHTSFLAIMLIECICQIVLPFD